MIYTTFLPGYYSALVYNQQQSIILDHLYFYVANGVTQDATKNDVPKTIKDEQETINQIIYGGKLTPSNMIAMIRKIPWEAGKVFTEYSSTHPMLGGQDFYCINSMGYVYKCLSNNRGMPSTQEPQTIIPGRFEMSDGYVWIFMYRLTESQLGELTVQDMIPIFVDPAVEAQAVPGTITTINVANTGIYNETSSGRIEQVINPKMVKIDDMASTLNGTYNEMGFYITEGAGQSEYYQITNYTSNTQGRFVHLSDTLGNAGVGSGYNIAPYVRINGNGNNGKARAIMAGTAVDRIQILDAGRDYSLATATLVANTIHSTAGTLDVNLSPTKGHAGNIYQELYVDNLMINIDFDNYTIMNDLPVDDISFCRVGMIRSLQNNDNTDLFTGDTFNNTFTAHIPPTSGEFKVGDIIKSPNKENPQAEVVYANTTHVIGVYHDQIVRFEEGNTLTNQNGVNGTILSIIQPEVRLIPTDVVTITNIDTMKRDDNSRETLQMLIRIK